MDGESGENTNEWFKAAVNCLNKQYWLVMVDIKKIGSESSILTISRPAGGKKL